IAICKERFPDLLWIEADMRTLDLGRRFQAILAWDSFFHLRRDEQRAMFPVFARHIDAGGVLLFTSGPDDSEAIGDLYGHELYHPSLAPDEHRALLSQCGFKVLRHSVEDPEAGGHTVWLAQQTAPL